MSAVWLLAGFLLGYACGRRRVTHKTVMVFPGVRERPLIYQLEGKLNSANNLGQTDSIKEDREEP